MKIGDLSSVSGIATGGYHTLALLNAAPLNIQTGGEDPPDFFNTIVKKVEERSESTRDDVDGSGSQKKYLDTVKNSGKRNGSPARIHDRRESKGKERSSEESKGKSEDKGHKKDDIGHVKGVLGSSRERLHSRGKSKDEKESSEGMISSFGKMLSSALPKGEASPSLVRRGSRENSPLRRTSKRAEQVSHRKVCSS